MINSNKMISLLEKYKYNISTGVPCAGQKEIIRALTFHPKVLHIIANKESEAIGIAAGTYLAGGKPVVYMQNSGFFNSINDINSLTISYRIPILFLVTWRGCIGENAPQHLENGRLMEDIVNRMNIFTSEINNENCDDAMSSAELFMNKNKLPAVLLIKKRKFL